MAIDYQHKGLRHQFAGAALLTNPTSASTNQYYGATNVTSQGGGELNSITAQVNSDGDHITLTTRVYGTETNSLFSGWVVRSVNPGTGFVIGPVRSIAAITTSYQVFWEVKHKG